VFIALVIKDQSAAVQVQAAIFDQNSTTLASLTAIPQANAGWLTVQETFVADSSQSQVRFTDTSPAHPNTGLSLDAVSVTQTPLTFSQWEAQAGYFTTQQQGIRLSQHVSRWIVTFAAARNQSSGTLSHGIVTSNRMNCLLPVAITPISMIGSPVVMSVPTCCEMLGVTVVHVFKSVEVCKFTSIPVSEAYWR